jgi:phosphoadenosine phosphosulfate reductase
VSRLLFEPVKAASRINDACLVAFSGGKDSVVTLDLCVRYFRRVEVFFMYLTPALSFQEAMLRWVEQRYAVPVHRVPHFMLSEWLAMGALRKMDLSVPIVSIKDIYQHLRIETGIWWIAAGERQADSVVRRAMMKRSGSIDADRGRLYPVAHFRKADIMAYIQKHKLKVAPESRFLGHSFRSLMPEEVYLMRKYYPADFEAIRRWFPFVEASVANHERALREAGESVEAGAGGSAITEGASWRRN